MSKCRFLTPCGICEIKSMSGIPYTCDLQRIGKLEEENRTSIPKLVEDKTYTDKGDVEMGPKNLVKDSQEIVNDLVKEKYSVPDIGGGTLSVR